MKLERIVLNGETWLSISEVSKLSSLPQSRIKSKINKSGNNSVIQFKRKKINNQWYIQESEVPAFQEEASILKNEEYYSSKEARKKIKGIYHNSSNTEVLLNWVLDGFLNDVVVRPKTSREYFIEKEWVDNFAKTKKYQMGESQEILGLTKRKFNFLINLPESDNRKIRTGKLPSGTQYITEDEINRQKEIEKFQINKGDWVSAGAGHSGKVEKILPCNSYNKGIKFCKGCEEGNRKRYSLSNGGEYCSKIIEKI